MAGEAQIQRTNRLGLNRQALNEIEGFIVGTLALACILSIVSVNRQSNVIGPVGASLGEVLG